MPFNHFRKKEHKPKHQEENPDEHQEVSATLVDTQIEEDSSKEQTHFDNTKKENELIEIISRKFIDEYKNTVNTLYKNLLKYNPEALRLYNPINVRIYHVIYNKTFFTHNEYLFFAYEKNANMDIHFLDLSDEKYYEYETHVFEKSEQDILTSAAEGLSRNDIVARLLIFKAALTLAGQEDFPYVKTTVDTLLSNETKDFHKHNNHQQEYYAKNAAKFAYSEIDLEPIIDKVDNLDFSYQLDQAIAAYDHSLYLPACATLGVCMETVCKLLLETNGVKIKDSDSTMLSQLNEKLKENNLINYKLKGRIDVCYKVRNLASHTSPGKIVKSDCHFILNTIAEVVETHF